MGLKHELRKGERSERNAVLEEAKASIDKDDARSILDCKWSCLFSGMY